MTLQRSPVAPLETSALLRAVQSSAQLRLALAWIYSESDDFDNMTKAYNLASSLVSGRWAAEEISEDWWAAQVIRLKALIRGAELARAASSASKPSPQVKEYTNRAKKMLVGLNTSSPGLGDDTRPQTRGELKALLKRIQEQQRKNGDNPVDLDLTRQPDPGK